MLIRKRIISVMKSFRMMMRKTDMMMFIPERTAGLLKKNGRRLKKALKQLRDRQKKTGLKVMSVIKIMKHRTAAQAI